MQGFGPQAVSLDQTGFGGYSSLVAGLARDALRPILSLAINCSSAVLQSGLSRNLQRCC